MSWPEDVLAFREVAVNTTASITVGTSASVALATSTSGTDPAFNMAAGVITFDQDCEFTSVFSVAAVCSSGTPIYYTDAEVSTDGGTTWVRGTNSCRAEELAAGYTRTREFTFSGRFAAGTKLRIVEWASATGITLATTAVGSSTIPARRMTYTRIPATIA